MSESSKQLGWSKGSHRALVHMQGKSIKVNVTNMRGNTSVFSSNEFSSWDAAVAKAQAVLDEREKQG